MAVVRWFAALIFTIAALAFAVSNIQTVSVNWSPLNLPVQMPLSLYGLGMMAAGFLAGVFWAWVRIGPLSRESRRQRKHVRALEREVRDLQDRPAPQPDRYAGESLPRPRGQPVSLVSHTGGRS